jgi:hypothetical protein
VFRTVIPDNMKAIVYGADPLEPRLKPADALLAQSVIDRLQSAAHELVLDAGDTGLCWGALGRPTVSVGVA